MKLLVLVFAAVALAQADTLKPAHIDPPFARRLGLSRPNPRITGGTEVVPHSRPFQVGLFIPTADGTAFCGGSLLSPTTVVTAAHCGELSNVIQVILGAHRIQENEPTQVIRNSSQVIVHSRWDSTSLLNDIAIIRLDPPVELNENIQPVALPSRANVGNSYEGNLATASGWGKDSDAATSISPVLREIQTPVGGNLVCNLYYFGAIADTHLCASGEGGKSTCSGDSGGPLTASTGELIGITSFGISLGCEIGWPAVFTRVTEYLSWIEENSDVRIL